MAGNGWAGWVVERFSKDMLVKTAGLMIEWYCIAIHLSCLILFILGLFYYFCLYIFLSFFLSVLLCNVLAFFLLFTFIMFSSFFFFVSSNLFLPMHVLNLRVYFFCLF